ncbi:ureidoglycolate hydrolase [Sphaeroforma arctica JP610]|uniref:Ureidoglycolate hydrolase n=1 Tax=Sphaeroforma arctica JP610 TaxID=667725 RepID=A0A0L0FTG6_9EUKA|nr:ureidoglycolate hydrolase [Sphaeroforma arctica JP610]KNC80077.1 ureidoglycolate hydrolase [Sphaeroforma arctica JP610]|eukprot:XP_014153979.1 ureidoglycolate hydrolase [Sphaeroforma arctica JP610]
MMDVKDLLLRAEPLTEENFKPYGDVIESKSPSGSVIAANQGSAVRSNRVAAMMNKRADAVANLCVFRCTPKELPFQCKLLERHPHSTQVFIPMMDESKRYLVIVSEATEGPEPDLSSLKAFIASNTQGISYSAGCWHHPMVALDAMTDFACLVYENGLADEDCQEHHFTQTIMIEG